MTDRAASPADFHAIPDRLREHARAQPDKAALVCDGATWSYAQLDAYTDSVAAALQREGTAVGDVVVTCAGTSLEYCGVFLGALRAGLAVAPLPPSATAAQLAAMVHDTGARFVFTDGPNAEALAMPGTERVMLDGAAGGLPAEGWRAAGHQPMPVPIAADATFNIIYSSGTTGAPKGIAQSHARRWQHTQALASLGGGPDAVALVATPLYSNTTLVVLFPMLALGGTTVLQPRFDATVYLALAERHRVTHTMLVPVQYQRILAAPGFDRADLSPFRLKICTGAPFAPELKAEVLRRWPGGLVELYGSTEGAGGCVLRAHDHPDKLHTVGRPAPGCVIRIIDDAGKELPAGEAGEVVGSASTMMVGYHNQPDATADAEWHDATGRRFLRTGDIGYLDADGFLVLVDRRKDMIISGGFNIYPADLEAELRQHPEVADAAVVGAPSKRWGETPVAFVVARPGTALDAEALRAWANQRLGKTQRIAQVQLVAELPRSEIGKVLKRELRARVEALA